MTARATPESVACFTCDVPLAPDALFCGACGAPAPRLPPGHAVASSPDVPSPALPVPALPTPVATRRSVAAASGTGAAASGAGQRSAGPRVLTVSPREVAPVGARIGALAIDQVLVCAIGAVAFAAAGLIGAGDGAVPAPIAAGAAMAVAVMAQWAAEARTGLTVGNLLVGIRTVASSTGLPAGLGRVILRAVVQGLGSVVPLVGVYVVAGSGAWDASPTQRGWHDKAAGTMVLRRDPVGRERTLTAPTPSAARPAASGQEPTPAPDALPSAPVSPPAPAPASAAAREDASGPRPPSGSSPVTLATQIWLVFDTGESIAVSGDGAVGRHPHGADGGSLAHAMAIDDPSRSISKLHLVFGPEPGGLWVVDRGSTNGTVIVSPDGVMRALPAGVRAHVAPGWVVRFGERAFRVEAR
ncbi:RDD family protein [Cellulomonas chengniuliangii]|uniref:RDD family protein n=1 Tax=Cellulomonas chengniuliangii TaxID=2968084 RepID=UPI001D0F375F|nr:RDD family protein [Cellulomonas chengniuliangii]MCC2316843.1 RDD family protein [Cellulomonas chengniuliangii]